MELHVWGPGFDLPSIDPECLAAITYLSIHLIPEDWTLIHGSDPSISPNRTLPALHHNSRWICGYDAIIRHINNDESIHAKAPPRLTPLQQADLVAYGAFVRQHGAPLLALSLYVSSANWSGATRPLYSRILRFPLPWTVPLGLRSRAHSCASHLNLSNLDADTEKPKPEEKSPFPSSNTLEALRSRIHVVTRAMTPDMRSHIRLDGLAGDFYGPLEELLKSTNMGKTFVLTGGHPTALDCLAYGYLALMYFPEVPRPFLKETMTRRHDKLVRFVVLMRNVSKRREAAVVQYSPPRGRILARFLDDLIGWIPRFGEWYMRWKRAKAEASLSGTTVIRWEAYDVLNVTSQILVGALLGTTAAAYKGLLALGPGKPGHGAWTKKRLGLPGFGEAGQMFEVAFNGLPSGVGMHGGSTAP